ncbi:MAG: hypothetical protein JRJ37_11075 [Deltaproteobacteria bacterium]|nr:hypothetical protein [Deltaproteobacteria bacterium]
MAEIRSTMDLVMERAARMGKASADELEQEDIRKQGMKLAAEFLDSKIDNLMNSLAELPGEKQMAVRQGMVEVLLRNIFLPRDETAKERTDRAAKGIVELGGGAGDLSSICAEMQHILGQYNQHREQLKTQLEEQVKVQYEQLLAQQRGGMPGESANPELALQAKIKEEWTRLETELSDQYNQALEQHKSTLKERLR